jgi:hypothetical protein
MLQSFARYRVLRATESLAEGEELTFVTHERVLDRYAGYPFYELVFVEKDLRVYVHDDEPEVEILGQPDHFFEKIGDVEPALAEQELAARRVLDRAQAIERERARMLEVAQEKLAKHRKKHPKS